MKKTTISIAFIVLLFLSPFIFWLLQGNEPLNVAIIDKTVPSEEYREHKGLTWVLNHQRYVKEDESDYLADTDYFGFMPDETKKDYEVRALKKWGPAMI